jgi:pimeloyl-[acyl-carrier protein] synthase
MAVRAVDAGELFGPAMVADPYSVYARLRAADPVHWHAPMNAWLLTRYADVAAALRDARLSSSLGDLLPESARAPGSDARGWKVLQGLLVFVDNSLVFSDPPRHTRLRALVSRAFTPRAVEAMRPMIQSLVDGMLDAVAPQGRMDVVRDLAYPLPIAVIASLLGFPAADRERIKQWSDDLLIPFGREPAALSGEELERASHGGAALADYVHGLVAEVRAHPRDDLLSALVHAAEAGERLSNDELFATVVLFLIAGHENLTSLIGCGTLALLEHPEELRTLMGDPPLLPGAVEELTRYVTPNQFIRRRATDDVAFGDQTIRRGQVVLLILAAANRDPAHFPDPDRLDVTRRLEWPLAFGHGPHYCLGAPLARLEAEIAFATLLRRFPRLRLASDDREYAPNFNMRQLTRLPVALA